MFYSGKKNKNLVVENYPSISKTYEWVSVSPDVEKVDLKLKPFLKDSVDYKEVKHNFQTDINSQFLITPEQMVKNNISIDSNKNVVYSDTTILKDKNATDIRDLAKEQVNQIIHNQAIDIANKQMTDFFANQKKQSENDEKNNESVKK